MYPELFTVPGTHYSISSFGLMLAVAFMVGYWITVERMKEEGLDVEPAASLLLWIMIGGVGGSKIYFAVDVWLREGIPFFDLLFARAGITWYGGLMGGALAGVLGCRHHRVPVAAFASSVAVALAVGQALGRVGCFLVGDDYGRPTDAAWGIAFPQGSPPTRTRVHPTQLYEVAWLLPVAALLFLRRKRSPFLLGEYMALNGLGRVVIEHWRVNPVVALGLTEPQWIGLLLIAFGAGGWIYFATRSGSTSTSG